jgi:hypothetical protein
VVVVVVMVVVGVVVVCMCMRVCRLWRCRGVGVRVEGVTSAWILEGRCLRGLKARAPLRRGSSRRPSSSLGHRWVEAAAAAHPALPSHAAHSARHLRPARAGARRGQARVWASARAPGQSRPHTSGGRQGEGGVGRAAGGWAQHATTALLPLHLAANNAWRVPKGGCCCWRWFDTVPPATLAQVLGVMKRYESIVQLPSRVRQHADAGDYEQVLHGWVVGGQGRAAMKGVCCCMLWPANSKGKLGSDEPGGESATPISGCMRRCWHQLGRVRP